MHSYTQRLSWKKKKKNKQTYPSILRNFGEKKKKKKKKSSY